MITPSRLLPLAVTLTLASVALYACSGGSQPAGTTPTKPGTDDGGAAPGSDAESTTPDPLVGLSADWKARAAKYMDGQAAQWLSSPPKISNVKCAMSCHTTFPYAMARPYLSVVTNTPAADTRARIEARVAEWQTAMPTPYYGGMGDAKEKESHGTEAVLNAGALVFDDLGAGRTSVGTTTQAALERMWKLQRVDGTWDWLEYGLFPWETRNDFGAAMAALMVRAIPEGSTPTQATGAARVDNYLKARLAATSNPLTFHDKVAVLWSLGTDRSVISEQGAGAFQAQLSAKQLEDGGFSLGSFGSGKIAAAGATQADGYATALSVLALCASDPEGYAREDVQRGLTWLATHQDASGGTDDGSWPGRSVNSTKALVKTYMTDASTAYAVLAITKCTKPASR
jgi:squalene-hopene/tetraprenyl-beta-curcumene cyclase